MRINILKQRLTETLTISEQNCLGEEDKDNMDLDMDKVMVTDTTSLENTSSMEERNIRLSAAKELEPTELQLNLPTLLPRTQLNHNLREMMDRTSLSLTKPHSKEISRTLWRQLSKLSKTILTFKTSSMASSSTWRVSSRTAVDQTVNRILLTLVRHGTTVLVRTSLGESIEVKLSPFQPKLLFAIMANRTWQESKWETTLTGHTSQDAF